MVDWIKIPEKYSGVDASSTGWHSPYNLHTDEGFTMYFLWFYTQVAAAVEELTPNQFDIQSMWAIVNGPGDSNVAHQHLGLIYLLLCGWNPHHLVSLSLKMMLLSPDIN